MDFERIDFMVFFVCLILFAKQLFVVKNVQEIYIFRFNAFAYKKEGSTRKIF